MSKRLFDPCQLKELPYKWLPSTSTPHERSLLCRRATSNIFIKSGYRITPAVACSQVSKTMAKGKPRIPVEQDSLFLYLPAELRNNIYEYVAVNTKSISWR